MDTRKNRPGSGSISGIITNIAALLIAAVPLVASASAASAGQEAAADAGEPDRAIERPVRLPRTDQPALEEPAEEEPEPEPTFVDALRASEDPDAAIGELLDAPLDDPGSADALWTRRMNRAHELADEARALGVPEDDPIIAALKAAWAADMDDLRMIAKTISYEAPYCPWWHQVAVGAVVLNRVADPRFAGTVYDVLISPGQYDPWYTYDFSGVRSEYYLAAAAAMDGGHDVPKNVVWQAQAVQGDGIWMISEVDTGWWSSVTYFCY